MLRQAWGSPGVRSWIVVLLLPCLLGAQPQPETTEPQAAKPKPKAVQPKPAGAPFIRIQRSADGKPLELQTAIARFESDRPEQQGVAVDLIGAVHVGELAYYEALNKAFADYDVVLYELIAPPGTRLPKGAKSSNNPVGALQTGLKDLLGLELQLEHVDYTQEKLVHADMSLEDLQKSMHDRGENVWTILLQMVAAGMARQAETTSRGKSFDGELLLALLNKNRALRLKQVLAEQFEVMGGELDQFGGPDGSSIITERNKVALAGVSQQLAKGKKRVAVFYGAAHLPDMQQRLETEFKLRRTGDRWLTAWKLNSAPAKPATAPSAPADSDAPAVPRQDEPRGN